MDQVGGAVAQVGEEVTAGEEAEEGAGPRAEAAVEAEEVMRLGGWAQICGYHPNLG